MVDTWAMFVKVKNGSWQFQGLTPHEEVASEFLDDINYDIEEDEDSEYVKAKVINLGN